MFEQPQTTAGIVASWPLPQGAHLADTIRRDLLATLDGGLGDLDPQTVAALAIGPLLIMLGRLEIDLADARTRIDQLERELRDR
ncbi:hypothetical protein ACFWPK_15720 [Nocardia sp. NPDC058519]|uniref:hypothetical protein n=1 Tax=unclassified Nocardia TaxID=2637762 RepID=UPI0036515FF0